MDASGIQRCKTGLSDAQVQQMSVTQEKSQWCWAASIAMVFAHHGYVLPQAQIVRQHFGDDTDRGVAGEDMTRMLGRAWQDTQGRSFSSAALAGDAHARRFQFANDTVIRELASQRPMIIGALGHAMVLVQVEYERFVAQDAVRITGGTVIDPMPGRGVRRLTAQESRPSYVVAVQVAVRPTLTAALGSDLVEAGSSAD